MTELIGVVAGSAQLLGQAAGLIIKAKYLWDEIDQAPSRIRDLMDEVQAYWGILANLESRGYDRPQLDGFHMLSSLDHYYRAHAALESLVQQLIYEIDSARSGFLRKVVGAKIVLKKSSVDHLETKLRRAAHMLQLSLLLSNRDWIGQIYDMNAKTLSLLLEMRQSKEDSKTTKPDITGTHSSVRSKRRSKSLSRQPSMARAFGHLSVKSHDSVCTITVKLPYWLMGTVWRLRMRLAFSFRHYNIRSEEADIFTSIRGGDLEKMRLLFSKGDASPFDLDSHGRSLIYYAAAFN
ncbi:uncharacterized protein DNG_08170 [Cephalotrichum gorgonifer]|uniref:Uncharacterized protein n=1 Tax=Cephalotrichum gorgonifer TaxID=2041049 RepID=A0AAE8N5J2_9PEZI|nr:uncharacterized protein DNG_08170 [Cephalotrichum gorgonifer]